MPRRIFHNITVGSKYLQFCGQDSNHRTAYLHFRSEIGVVEFPVSFDTLESIETGILALKKAMRDEDITFQDHLKKK